MPACVCAGGRGLEGQLGLTSAPTGLGDETEEMGDALPAMDTGDDTPVKVATTLYGTCLLFTTGRVSAMHVCGNCKFYCWDVCTLGGLERSHPLRSRPRVTTVLHLAAMRLQHRTTENGNALCLDQPLQPP